MNSSQKGYKIQTHTMLTFNVSKNKKYGAMISSQKILKNTTGDKILNYQKKKTFNLNY
jgi:hypothetical protein